MKRLARRWRLITALMAMSFFAFTLYIFIHRSEARQVVDRVQIGMPIDEFKLIVARGKFQGGYQHIWDARVIEGEIRQFRDKSEVNVCIKNGCVESLAVVEPEWQFNVRYWLLTKLGINSF